MGNSAGLDGEWGGRPPAPSVFHHAGGTPGPSGGSSIVSGPVKTGTLGVALWIGGEGERVSVGVGGPSSGVGLPAVQSIILSGTERARTRLGPTFDDTPVGVDAPLFEDISVLFAAVVITYEQDAS